MNVKTIGLADAKAQLSELAERASRGETVVLTKHGNPVAQIVRAGTACEPVSLDRLRQLTDTMPKQSLSAGAFLRQQRDASRY